MYQETFMRRAIELSSSALDIPGTQPFGAVVVRDGEIVGEGLNRSVLNSDPTSHGETEAIRDACRKLGTTDLSGCELYTSCEPCALCVAAMEIAGISQLYYAANLEQANSAMDNLAKSGRPSIDSKRLRIETGKSVGERSMPSRQALDNEATEVLIAWAAKMNAHPQNP